MDLEKETELIQKTQQDLANFTQIYDLYVKDVYRFIYSMVNNKTEAEDITSETFLKALENIKNYKITPGKSIKAWLFTISKNIIFNKYKKDIWAVVDQEIFENVQEKDDSILDKVCDQDILNRVTKYIDTEFDKVVKNIIKLKLWDDLTFEEIAELMQLKTSTVKMKYYRAIEKLKQNFVI